jgi:quinol monooxygenase YgiN
MELHMFGRFHTLTGEESAFEEALKEVIPPSRGETGCLEIHGYRSIRDARLFYIHSKWRDEKAFETHTQLPHTLKFLKKVETLIDHPLEVTRAERVA